MTRRSLKNVGVTRLFILTSTSMTTEVFEFVVFNLGVENIWRTVWAIIRPSDGKHEDTSLLLGLPWLWNVKGVINVRDSTLKIGNVVAGELGAIIHGPLMTQADSHKLVVNAQGPSVTLMPDTMTPSSSSPAADADDEGSSSDISSSDVTTDSESVK